MELFCPRRRRLFVVKAFKYSKGLQTKANFDEMSQPNESICSKVFVKLWNRVNYFGDESNLHGIGYVFSMSFISFFKRLFWLIIMICCCLGSAVILRRALVVYSSDLVSYSVETNYLKWDTPFPAITLCEQVDNNRLKAFLLENKLPMTLTPFLKENVYWNQRYCVTCTDCKVNVTCMTNIQEYVYKIRRNCSEMLSDCRWGNKPFNCCDKFQPLETEFGICYAFNSRLASNSTILTVNRRVGLPSLVLSCKRDVQMRVHSPDDMVTVAMEDVLGDKFSYIKVVSDFEVILKAEQTISDISVSKLSSEARGCLYEQERPAQAHLWPFPIYTYNACLMYCKALGLVDICNCTHHLMPKLRGIRVCDIPGMTCLYNFRDNLRNLNCECPMGCEEMDYKTVHVNLHRHKNPSETLVKRGTSIKVQLAQLPALRVRRYAIRDTLGLVVDIGGVGGVFFGASLLSVIEIIYIFFIRRGP